MVRSRQFFATVFTLCFALTFTIAAKADEDGHAVELSVAFNEIDVQLDPHHSIYSAEAQIFTGIYEGLFSYDPVTLDPVKASCRSFSRSKDGLTYTFYLREAAVWSDGTPLLARDFRDAWLRALAPAEKADYASFFDIIAGAKDYRLGKKSDPASVGITVIDDRVLQVKLEAPAAYFTRLLCHHSFSPIHPSMLASKDWKSASPLPVNGPYRVVSSSKDEMLLEKNPRYWDADLVRLEKIRMVFSDDDEDATRRFDNGEIQWLAGPMDPEALLDRGSIQVSPMFGTQYWFFDCSIEPWNNRDMRRALALLVPWKEIRSKDNYTIPATTLVLPFDGYDETEGITATDEAEAKRLFEKAGFTEGKTLPPLVIIVPAESEDAVRDAGLMESAWEKIPGLTVELKKVPSASYYQVVRAGPKKGDYNLGLTTWIGDFADPLAFLGMWTSDSNLNDARHLDPEYDRLIADSSFKEGEERLKLLTKAETRLLEGAAVLPIHHSIAVNIVDDSYLEGWFANALDLHPFKYLGFGERKVRPNVALAAGGEALVY